MIKLFEEFVNEAEDNAKVKSAAKKAANKIIAACKKYKCTIGSPDDDGTLVFVDDNGQDVGLNWGNIGDDSRWGEGGWNVVGGNPTEFAKDFCNELNKVVNDFNDIKKNGEYEEVGVDYSEDEDGFAIFGMDDEGEIEYIYDFKIR